MQMVTDEEKGGNKDKPYDEISELLKNHYKPEKTPDQDIFWDELSKRIDSLFHSELFSDKIQNDEGQMLSDEDRYWQGLEEYLKNEVSSLKHKTITDHLLSCKECRQNYSNLLDKKSTA